MSEREPGEEQPSLELPSLGASWHGWRRTRREKRAAEPEPEPEPEPVGGGWGSTPPPRSEPKPPPDLEPEPEPVSGGSGSIPPPRSEPKPPPAGERRLAIPTLPTGGPLTVALVGLVVGLAIVGLTWASLQTCEQVQGTSSCGTAGYPMLGFVVVLSVVVGAVLLRLGRVPDHVSTSFLGVGLAAVIALLVLIDHLDSPAMVVVIPLITALTFTGAHWVTTTFVDPDDR